MLRVSSKEREDGDTVAMMQVFAFPPKDSLSNRVSLLSLIKVERNEYKLTLQNWKIEHLTKIEIGARYIT